MFDIAVTLKYGQGYRKWCEQVKLNEKYHDAEFDISRVNLIESE